jgi:hypothetical protein
MITKLKSARMYRDFFAWMYVAVGSVMLGCVALAVALSMNCCDNPEPTGPGSEEPITWLTKQPDDGAVPFEWQDEAGGSHPGMCYSTSSTVGSEAVESVLGNMQAAQSLVMLEEQGFEIQPERCTMRETDVERDGLTRRLYMTLVIFEQETADPYESSFAGLLYTKLRGQGESMQLEKMFIGADPWVSWDAADETLVQPLGLYQNETVWSQSFRPWLRSFVSDLALAPKESQEWDWLQWLACTAEHTAAGCAAGGLVCAFTAGPYDDCVNDACTQAAVGGAIACAADQLW